MNTELVAPGTVAIVTGWPIQFDYDFPHLRKLSDPMIGIDTGLAIGPRRTRMKLQCDDGTVIYNLPAAGFPQDFKMRVRVTVEILPP